jgi:hypothetical protein
MAKSKQRRKGSALVQLLAEIDSQAKRREDQIADAGGKGFLSLDKLDLTCFLPFKLIFAWRVEREAEKKARLKAKGTKGRR